MSVIVRLSGRGEVPMIPEPIVILDSGFMTLEREREREREREMIIMCSNKSAYQYVLILFKLIIIV